MWLMTGFGAWQLFGAWQSYWFGRPTWWGVASFSGWLLFLIGLNYFDWLLLNSYQRLRTRIAKVPLVTENQEDVAQAIRHTVKPELLNEPE